MRRSSHRSAAEIRLLLPELNAGETVLDLGSGGGIDVLLSAKRVGPTGKAYGPDKTDEMLALARENPKKSGITNGKSARKLWRAAIWEIYVAGKLATSTNRIESKDELERSGS